MKKWFIAAAVAGVLAIGAFAFVGITTTSVSAAEEDPTTTEDDVHGQWHDELLDRLGLIARRLEFTDYLELLDHDRLYASNTGTSRFRRV